MKKLVVISMVLVFVGYAQATVVFDNFNRADNETLGATSDGSDSWDEVNGDPPAMRIESNILMFNYAGSDTVQSALLNTFNAADVEVSAIYEAWTSGTNWEAALRYRVQSTAPGGWDDGYAAIYDQAETKVWLRYGNTNLGEATLTTIIGGVPKPIRVVAVGDYHKLYYDDSLVLEVTDSSRLTPCQVGLFTWNTRALFDDFSAEVVPEPATMALLGLGGLFLLRRK